MDKTKIMVVVVVDPTPPTCCQQSPAPESCGSQQSLPPGGKDRLHFVGIRPEVQARKGGWYRFALKEVGGGVIVHPAEWAKW